LVIRPKLRRANKGEEKVYWTINKIRQLNIT